MISMEPLSRTLSMMMRPLKYSTWSTARNRATRGSDWTIWRSSVHGNGSVDIHGLWFYLEIWWFDICLNRQMCWHSVMGIVSISCGGILINRALKVSDASTSDEMLWILMNCSTTDIVKMNWISSAEVLYCMLSLILIYLRYWRYFWIYAAPTNEWQGIVSLYTKKMFYDRFTWKCGESVVSN